jgi:signal peptidase I
MLATLKDYGGTIAVAVIVALIIRVFIIEAYRIPSSAMRPSLEPGDTIFVVKWPYVFSDHKPTRGEVVVFALPMPDDSSRDYIKRVAAVAGDTVQIKDGHLLVNGHSTEIPGSENTNCAAEKTVDGFTYPVCFEKPTIEDAGPEKVPEGSVYLLGDLRARTTREVGTDRMIKSWGIQPLKALKGTAKWIWLSVQPQSSGVATGLFPSLRFNRMFRRIQ